MGKSITNEILEEIEECKKSPTKKKGCYEKYGAWIHEISAVTSDAAVSLGYYLLRNKKTCESFAKYMDMTNLILNAEWEYDYVLIKLLPNKKYQISVFFFDLDVDIPPYQFITDYKGLEDFVKHARHT